MPILVAAGRWEAKCAHCFVESDVVTASSAEAAGDALRAMGWLSAHPDGEPVKWWCHQCRAQLFEAGRRGRRR